MNRDIFIIVDNSGSMNEIAKPLLTRNLFRGISQLSIVDPKLYSDVRFHFLLWASSINKVTFNDVGDIPIPTPNGLADLESLRKFINEQLFKMDSVMLLLLSDGDFALRELKKFCDFSGNKSGCIIHTLAIGADANEFNLKKIATNNEMFRSEDVLAAISSLIHYRILPITLPSSITCPMLKSQKILSEV